MDSNIPNHPSSSNNRLFIGIAVVLLIATGSIITWKVTRSVPTEPAATVTAAVTEEESPRANVPPPPPPPDIVEEPATAPSTQSASTNGLARSAKSPCSGECNGEVTGALRSALAGRGGAGRRCYEKSLSQNPTLSGKMTVHVKVSPQGSVCAASVANDTLQDAALNNCILGVFRSSTLPAPQGGCVEIDVPLSFVPGK